MQDSRLLSMLLILSNSKKITAKSLASHFEVSIRTIYRDIDKLTLSGVPIVSIGGKGGGYYIMDNYHIDNLFLNKNEIEKVITLAHSLDTLFGKNKQFNEILLKLNNTNKNQEKDKTLNINLSHFAMEEELKDYLYIIDQAIENNQLLSFDYINRRIENELRIVEPIQISFSSGSWYLIAFCRNRNDYRQFKLVRMRKLTLGEKFSKKIINHDALTKIFTDSFKNNSILVVLKFSKEYEEHLPEHFQKKSIEKRDDCVIVKDYFPFDEGLIKFILSFGDNCEVLEPFDLRQKVKECLHNIQKKYID